MRSFSAGFEYDQSMYVRAFVTQVHGRFIVKVGRMTSSGATAAFVNPSVSKRAVAAVRAKAHCAGEVALGDSALNASSLQIGKLIKNEDHFLNLMASEINLEEALILEVDIRTF